VLELERGRQRLVGRELRVEVLREVLIAEPAPVRDRRARRDAHEAERGRGGAEVAFAEVPGRACAERARAEADGRPGDHAAEREPEAHARAEPIETLPEGLLRHGQKGERTRRRTPRS
jgi:hypothetical protein